MSQHRHENAIRIVGVHQDPRYLLAVAQSQVLPRLSSVRRFVNSVADRKVRPLQSFAASHINDVRIRRRHRDRAHRLCRLAVENRIPRLAVVGALPHSAIHLRHVKQVGLAGHSRRGHRSSATEGPNAPPSHVLIKLRTELLRNGHRSHCKRNTQARNHHKRFHFGNFSQELHARPHSNPRT